MVIDVPEGSIRMNRSDNPSDWEQLVNGRWVPFKRALPKGNKYEDLLKKYGIVVDALKACAFADKGAIPIQAVAYAALQKVGEVDG